MNKEQKAAHVDALERERLGYEARLEKVELDPEEKLNAEQLQSRIDQVDEQIKLHGGQSKQKAKPKAKPKPKPEPKTPAKKEDSDSK